jgi:TATA-binding protein-associated factor Taf7
LVLSVKPQATQASIQPAPLRREEDISTASESSELPLSDDDDCEATQEGIDPQEEEEEEESGEKENNEIEEEEEEEEEKEIIVFEVYTVELSVLQGKKAI